jgi:sepiapterin reductase
MILSARSVDALAPVRDEMAAAGVGRVVAVGCDFVKAEDTAAFWSAVDREARSAGGRGLVIENAGVIHPIGPLGHKDVSSEEITRSVDVNTRHFAHSVHFFARLARSLDAPPKPHVFVNISSLAALQPFPTWSLYCASKAFRDMLVRGLADESDPARVRALSYAPGPCDTDMQGDIRASGDRCDAGIQRYFADMKSDGRLVTPDETAAVLVRLVAGDVEFSSGAHVDIFDINPPDDK